MVWKGIPYVLGLVMILVLWVAATGFLNLYTGSSIASFAVICGIIFVVCATGEHISKHSQGWIIFLLIVIILLILFGKQARPF